MAPDPRTRRIPRPYGTRPPHRPRRQLDGAQPAVLPRPAAPARICPRGPDPGRAGRGGRHIGHVSNDASIGLREAQSQAHPTPYDRYAVGVHHVAFRASGRWLVDERAAWLREQGVEIESGPRDYDYISGYYAVFFYDPDGIKLEIVHVPQDPDLAAAVAELTEKIARLGAR